MNNKPLKTIFHMTPEKVESEYQLRFNNPYSIKLDMFTKKDTQNKEYQMFICLTPEMLLQLEKIHTLILQLERVIIPIPPIAINQFFTSCLREEIQATNEIEGVHSSRREIDYALEQQQNPHDRKSTRLWGIVNKYQKLITQENIPFNTCEDLRNFYNDFALDEVLNDEPQNAPDGKYFRKNSVSVNDGIKDIHTGVYPEDKIISTMTSALSILNNENIPLLIRVSLYHYLFGYIHPFYDGNGRTSRFITSYYLTNKKNPLSAIRLSVTIKRTKRYYYKIFENANNLLNKGELTHFVLGFLAIYEKSLTKTIQILEEKSESFYHYQKLLLAKKIDATKSKIYSILLQASLFSDHMGATVREIAQTVGNHENTIQRHLQKMQEDNDYIIVHKEHRAYRYELNLKSFFNED